MKTLLTFIAVLLCVEAVAQTPFVLKRRHKIDASASITYIRNQGFEGTGFDNSESWTKFGTVNEDYTTTVHDGSQSLYATAAGGAYTIISDIDSMTVECWFYVVTLPGGTISPFGVRNSSGNSVCIMQINSSGNIAVFSNGSAATFTSAAMSTGTWYRVRLVWLDSGTCSVEFSASGTFTGSGTGYSSKTGGTTADATRIYCGQSSTTVDFIFDKVQAY